NLKMLKERGIEIIGPAIGEQACGEIGPGRMVEPEKIVEHLNKLSRVGVNLRVLITAGPTQEAIDPVRYISNHSSGKMGYALAEAFVACGAQVILISGPADLTPPKNLEKF